MKVIEFVAVLIVAILALVAAVVLTPVILLSRLFMYAEWTAAQGRHGK